MPPTGIPSAILITISIASAVIALVGVIITTASFRTARTSLQQSRTTLVTQLRNEWVKLHDDWTMSIALAQGPSDYYSGATAAQREELRLLAMSVASSRPEDRQAPVFSYHQHVKRVTKILDLCAIVALQGRLPISDIYGIFGLDVARHANSVRWMLGMKEAEWWETDLPPSFAGERWLAPVTDDNSHARQQRIMTLIDLRWAHACRTGDLQAHIMMDVASHKQKNSGPLNLRRVRNLAQEWRGGRHALRLQSAILFGHFIPAVAIYQDAKPILGQNHWSVVRIGFWRLRAAKIVLQSFMVKTARIQLLKAQLFGRLDEYGNSYPPRWRKDG